MFLAGYLYAVQASSPGDFVEAAHWLEKSAARGIPAAMTNIGLLYVRGLGVPQDFVLGHMWINLSVALGLPEAQLIRDSVASGMSAQEINEAQQLAQQRWASLRH